VLDRCLAVRPGEQVMLLTDDGTDGDVVERLVAGIEARRAIPVVSRIPMPPLPGSEPPSSVAAAMREAGAVIELTSLFIGSSLARRTATQAGVRYLAMPGVRWETFRDDGPLAVDFDAIRGDAERIGDLRVREVEHVAVDHRRALHRRQRPHRRPELGVTVRVRGRHRIRQLFDRERPAAFAPPVVQRLAGRDREQPSSEVARVLQTRVRPERRQERLLETIVRRLPAD